MYLFFDVETTGLPKDYNAHVHDTWNWPRMVQLAFAQYSFDGKKLSEHSYIIKPEGYDIPTETSDIHRITTARATAEGIDLKFALGMFALVLANSTHLVAHNISFDKKIIGAEFIRNGLEECYNLIKLKDKICTMRESTNFCQLPGTRGYKWPKLEELHMKLFGTQFLEAHDALVDVNAMVKCFFELKKLKVIE